MPTVWGTLDHVQSHDLAGQWVQIRTILSGGMTIRIRALIEDETIVARGIQRVDVSSLREGESVDVTYRCGNNGFIEAEMIYVQPDKVTMSPETTTRSSKL
jgi:hypothetical protein